MEFQPKKIKRKHVLKALLAIDKGTDVLRESTKFDIFFEGKTYPPKEVMRLAHEYATGNKIWNKIGGEPTHKYIRALGFKIVNKEDVSPIVSTENTKEKFADWLLKNAPESYDSYLGKTISSIKERLDEVNSYFLERDIFIIKENDYTSLIEYLKFKNSKEERLKNKEFYDYDKKHSRGIPMAIVGKKNYFKFLEEEYNAFFVMDKDLYKLKEQFLKEWPVTRVKTMTLEEYTNLDKESSFCYWLEARTTDLGSIWGGSAYKFGIYRRKDLSSKSFNDKRKSDGEYAWYGKYGETKEEAFNYVKSIILNIIDAITKDRLDEIDAFDLGFAYKWKIAFLYGNFNSLNLFNEDVIRKIATNLDISFDNNTSASELHKLILAIKGDKQDYFDFTKKIWDIANDELVGVKRLFFDWLKSTENSKKAPSYLRAIDILNEILEIDIYAIKDIAKLTLLYDDLLEKQKEVNGKYYYEKAPSYGKNRFYSASIKAFIQFTEEAPGITQKQEKSMNTQTLLLNSIFYGPPGTGKTYKTIKDAVAIANPDFDVKQERAILKEEYKRLVNSGQIVFTTFHQSMSYEDFVEGIKPVLDQENNAVGYEIQDGILKTISNRAKGIAGEAKLNTSNVDFKNCNYFKMSLGGKNRKDIHDWCITNNKIAIGYGGKNDLNTITTNNWHTYKSNFKDSFPELVERTSYSATATYAFKVTMKKGDIVLASLGNHIIDAIGVIKDEYQYSAIAGIPYHHFREVEWLAIDLNANPNLFVDKKISQQTIYQFNNDDIKIDYLESLSSKKSTSALQQNYVLIIDEINRGNVSAIFGELITLLEPDKRLGRPEEISLMLPYSKEESFGLPSNLHIIGTMNTADRSVEALDTALRRRFVFEEVMPNPELLKEISFNGFNLSEVLELINNRIEALLDRDHTIGHSYFIKLNSGDTQGLLKVFQNNIIPLLQEYFYNDYQKIALVLGAGFIKEKEIKKNIFPKFKSIDEPDVENTFALINPIENIEEAVLLLLKTNE